MTRKKKLSRIRSSVWAMNLIDFQPWSVIFFQSSYVRSFNSNRGIHLFDRSIPIEVYICYIAKKHSLRGAFRRGIADTLRHVPDTCMSDMWKYVSEYLVIFLCWESFGHVSDTFYYFLIGFFIFYLGKKKKKLYTPIKILYVYLYIPQRFRILDFGSYSVYVSYPYPCFIVL